MPNQLLLLSTCGTSLLTNGATTEERDWLSRISNQTDSDLIADDKKQLQVLVTARRESLQGADDEKRRKLSAELNGIHSVLKRWPAERVTHYLVHTDTAAGAATATLVQGILEEKEKSVQLLTTAGLRTDNLLNFRAALSELSVKIDEIVPGYREQGWTIVFNLSGGFKSINGYLQALGMIHADSCVFLFERAADLMEIPRLPVQLASTKELRKHNVLFRRMERDYVISQEEAQEIPDSLLLIVDEQVAMSVWGSLVWKRAEKTLLAEELGLPNRISG